MINPHGWITIDVPVPDEGWCRKRHRVLAAWTLKTELKRRSPAARCRIIEDERLEDENGMRHHVSPYDRKNLLKSAYPH